jgi:hypothetical protein
VLATLNESLKRIYKLEAGGHIDEAITELRSDADALGDCWVRAKAYVQIGRLELRLGHNRLATEASEKAVQIQNTLPALSAIELGLAHYVSATGLVGIGNFARADRPTKNRSDISRKRTMFNQWLRVGPRGGRKFERDRGGGYTEHVFAY